MKGVNCESHNASSSKQCLINYFWPFKRTFLQGELLCTEERVWNDPIFLRRKALCHEFNNQIVKLIALPVIFRNLLTVWCVPLEVLDQAWVWDVGLAGEEKVPADGEGERSSRQNVQTVRLTPMQTAT